MPYEPLGHDAVTAFRLVMDEDGTAAMSLLMASWGLLQSGLEAGKRTVGDLPPSIRREVDRAVHDGPLEPIVLTQDEVVMEAFRYAAMRKAPDEDGWHLHSEVVRAGNVLGYHTVFVGDDGVERRFNNHAQHSPHIEVRRDRNDTMSVRLAPNGATRLVEGVIPTVEVTVTCPGDAGPRKAGGFKGFGFARQHVLRQDTTMIADGTRVVLSRAGDDDRVAIFDAASGTWRSPDGTSFRRIDAADGRIHQYPNGEYVGGLIGYTTFDRKGRHHACIGEPFNSSGDDDAMVRMVGRREASSHEEALAFLAERDDLDRVFTQAITINSMGVWLRPLKDEPETGA